MRRPQRGVHQGDGVGCYESKAEGEQGGGRIGQCAGFGVERLGDVVESFLDGPALAIGVEQRGREGAVGGHIGQHMQYDEPIGRRLVEFEGEAADDPAVVGSVQFQVLFVDCAGVSTADATTFSNEFAFQIGMLADEEECIAVAEVGEEIVGAEVAVGDPEVVGLS